MRVEAWFAIAMAFSSVPPFLRQAVIPVARKIAVAEFGGDAGRGPR